MDSMSDIKLSKKKKARIMDILDIMQNMDEFEVAEWIDYILTQDKKEKV